MSQSLDIDCAIARPRVHKRRPAPIAVGGLTPRQSQQAIEVRGQIDARLPQRPIEAHLGKCFCVERRENGRFPFLTFMKALHVGHEERRMETRVRFGR